MKTGRKNKERCLGVIVEFWRKTSDFRWSLVDHKFAIFLDKNGGALRKIVIKHVVVFLAI